MQPGNVCNTCSFQYALRPDNTVVHYFLCQAYMTYASTICPKCQTDFSIFIRKGFQPMMEFFITQSFPFITEDYAPDDIARGFEEVFSLKELPEYALTSRLEAEVNMLGDILAHIPDELLWLELSDPEPPHTKPEMWT